MKLPVEGREEEEDLEYYGPIDGILPHDHPEAYYELLTMYCIIKNVIRIYTCDELRVCTNCYEETSEGEKEYYEEGGWHCMGFYSTAVVASKCFKCNAAISIVRAASQCTECIEEYFELGHEGWTQLLNGKTIDVITRW